MLYLQIQAEAQVLTVPRAAGRENEVSGLVFRLRRGGVETAFSDLNDLDVNENYFTIEMPATTGLVVGEYDYSLENADGDVYSTGILTAGNYVRTIKDVPGGAKVIEYGGK